MALRNKAFGTAQEFVWAFDSSEYATLENSSTIKVFKNFKERKSFKPEYGAEGIFGGFMLGVKSISGMAFSIYDWEHLELIRRIEIQPRHVFWSESGSLVCLATDEAYFILRYNAAVVTLARETNSNITEDGIEDAFEDKNWRVLETLPLLRARYWPTPWCLEARLQTVLGSLLRSVLLPRVAYSRQLLRLADGGTVALDWVQDAGGPTRPVLLVLPGLTGGSEADYARCLALAARDLGAHCVVFNQRGLGGLPLTSPRLYCAVSRGDLAEVVAAVAERAGAAPLLAVGMSLGGLILGQYLAEYGDKAAFAAAFIVSSPLDVVKGGDS